MSHKQKLTVDLHPNLTKKQQNILRSRKMNLLLEGPAGTSKTYIAIARGLIQLAADKVKKIVIIRSAVAVRDMGFMPGDLEEKTAVYAEPYHHLVSQLSPKRNLRAFMTNGDIEVATTSFLRGVTFDDTYIIADEYQNMSAHELHTILTRVGDNTQLVLCGDSDQSDLRGREADEHHDEIAVVRRMETDFDIFQFTVDEVVRSDFVRRYYHARKGIDRLSTTLN